MRLHRLVLTNYRGIAHRDIDFPASGVTIVSGPNEVGKSSMIEAIDLLLESKDRSSKKDVRQVKPTHADVGSEITAEISTGPYRFVYRKRFHKQFETELTILEPRREQLTGDEAHNRVRSMLEETVDTGLWQAQRVLQSASTTAVDLSACDALSRALDLAATDYAESAAGLSSTEPVLIEKIDAEYARYFTATGRPTGEWAAVTGALKSADDEVAHCVSALAEVDDRVARHAALTEELAALAADRAAVAERLSAAERAADAVAELVAEHHSARARATTAKAEHGAAAAAHRERLRLRSEVSERAAALDGAQTAATQAAEAEAVGRDMVVEAEKTAQEAADGLQRVRVRVGELRRALDAQRIADRLARIDGTQVELDALAARIGAITLTDKAFRSIENAAGTVDIARAQAELAAPTAQLTAESAVEVLVGERSVALAAGETFDIVVSETTTIRLPGVLTTTLRPDAAAAESQAKLIAAQHHLAELLEGSGVADLDEARRVDHERRALLGQRDQLTERLAGVLGTDDPEQLRSRLAELRAGQAAVDSAADPARLQAELQDAQAEFDAAETRAATQQKVAFAASAQLSERSTAAAVLRDKAITARTERVAVEERLARLRTEAADDDLAVRAEQTAAAEHTADAACTELSARLAEAGADTVTAELAAARAADADVDGRYRQAEQALRNESVALDVIGAEGRAGKLDAASIRQKHARAEYARVQDRANAARMLRTVMNRHRDDTRQRYVEPFRTEVERLGRTVFGSTFEVDVDSDLQIRSRTLAGRTVPFESLSGGAKEQLGIVARLAVAALVANEDTVPVMIDDALGFTDSERLARMGTVFDKVGADGQVIVLTCSPDRYDGVAQAHRVHLTP